MKEFDRYSEKAAEAMSLIREFSKKEYYEYFKGDPERALEEFVAMMDCTACKTLVLANLEVKNG